MTVFVAVTVNKHDALADFSSRGPRSVDHGIKPDITAPGIGIVAARAAGTSLGTVIDSRYTQADGTSMAAAHVAGAAALIAQRFPGDNHRQLKDRLVSTSLTIGGQTVYEQGGGRVAVATGNGYASPGTLSLGSFRYPHAGQASVTKRIIYPKSSWLRHRFTGKPALRG